MKRLTLFCLGLAMAAMLMAQSPAAFNYQAVVRDAAGAVKANQDVSFRITILQGSATGTAVFGETHAARTNEFGLVNLEIGHGNNLLGSLADIDWGTGPYFLKVQFDPAGGTSYILMGTMQLLSVPYALYSKSSGGGFNGDYNSLINKPVILNNDLYSTATGFESLKLNTGTSNTANGFNSLWSNTSGYSNTAYGANSLYSNTTGFHNTAVGISALYSNTSGEDNTVMGVDAAFSNKSGKRNTVIGYGALTSNATGNDNTIVGYQAGLSNPYGGSGNIFIGSSAGHYEEGSNKLIIDNQPRASQDDARRKALIYGEFDADPANQKLKINGNIIAAGYRIKEVAEPVDAHDAANKVYVDKLLARIKQLESWFGIDEFVTDCEQNVYKAVKIGTQLWIAENLRTGSFNDCIPIPFVKDSSEWANLVSPGYCWSNNDEVNFVTYGALYNGYAMETGKLCPSGWHVPSDDEWKVLERYLGMDETDVNARYPRESGLVGQKLKTTNGWSGNGNGNNFSGFSALPGANRTYVGFFELTGYNASFWSSTHEASYSVWFRNLNSYHVGVYRNSTHLKEGLSVRCLKD